MILINLGYILLMEIKEYMIAFLMIKMVIDLNFKLIVNKFLFLKMFLQKMEMLIFQEIDNLKGKKIKIKPFTNLFKDLADYDPNKHLKKKIRKKNDDEEYKPILTEIKEVEKENKNLKIKNWERKE